MNRNDKAIQIISQTNNVRKISKNGYRVTSQIQNKIYNVTKFPDTRHYYCDSDLSTMTTTWHHTDTLEEAEDLVRRLGKSKGGKHCRICLDGTPVM